MEGRSYIAEEFTPETGDQHSMDDKVQPSEKCSGMSAARGLL